MAALGLMKTVLGKKRRRVYRESHPLGASAPTETDRPKKKRQKSEFAKEIHCTLKKKSWRRKEIQTERKWAFASIKASTKPKWMNLMMMMMVIKDDDCDDFFTFYINSFNESKKKEKHGWKASLSHLREKKSGYYCWYCYCCDICDI